MFARSVSVRVLAALLVTFLFGVLAPTGSAEAATCVGAAYNGQLYCASPISQVNAGAYAVGTRVLLESVSVTASTPSTVTVAAWEVTACPRGYFCGATMDMQSLTVAWTGQSRPAAGTVINLFGTATRGSLSPVGYSADPYGCYVDYC